MIPQKIFSSYPLSFRKLSGTEKFRAVCGGPDSLSPIKTRFFAEGCKNTEICKINFRKSAQITNPPQPRPPKRIAAPARLGKAHRARPPNTPLRITSARLSTPRPASSQNKRERKAGGFPLSSDPRRAAHSPPDGYRCIFTSLQGSGNRKTPGVTVHAPVAVSRTKVAAGTVITPGTVTKVPVA